MFKPSLLAMMAFVSLSSHAVSPEAQKTADYALATYKEAMISSLADLVQFNTVAVEGLSATDNPQHIAFKAELAKQAKALGFDFEDFGYVVRIGLGKGEQRVGVITHGDVQPVNPKKWAQSPFKLDRTSEPGKLLGRGTEDDKGPISTALYAMKAIKDQKIALNKRIELYVYMAEESDWAPLIEFVKQHDLPQTNITIDAEYPAVTAEKGYGTLSFNFTDQLVQTPEQAYIKRFEGGFFGSQIPEDAKVCLGHADQALLDKIKQRAALQQGMKYSFDLTNDELTITALGVSAHSSKPEDGINAITYLADILAVKHWPFNAAGAMVNFINDNLGTGLYGKKFGDIAYADDFMGPMTVQPTVIKQQDDGVQLNINIRRPRGKTAEQLEQQIIAALNNWANKNSLTVPENKNKIGDPFVQTSAPQIPTLMDVFSHYTGIKDAKPISIGGGTNSRLFPNAVSFGPSMPGEVYTGHSEHEFITEQQLSLNLKMYTAVLIELAK